MAHSHGKGMEKFAAFNLTPADLAAEAKRRIEEFADAQTKQLDKLQETNRLWLDRMQAEAKSCFGICLEVGRGPFAP